MSCGCDRGSSSTRGEYSRDGEARDLDCGRLRRHGGPARQRRRMLKGLEPIFPALHSLNIVYTAL
jgi:hypothetical protein